MSAASGGLNALRPHGQIRVGQVSPSDHGRAIGVTEA
jgi:hypothetical protein